MRKTPWVALLLFSLLLFVPGCLNPPEGTLWIDTDANGRVDTLALDLDKNGVPDLDPNGSLMVVAYTPTKGLVEGTEDLDIYGPGITSLLGTILSGPLPWAAAVLLGIASVWKGTKFGRIILNLVMAIQAIRQKAEDGNKLTRPEIDKLLESIQTPETTAAVEKAKDKGEVTSVTDTT